ncbi:hypothetical protein IE81DRAFT_289951 [Ceraceosorus guamensis]|uniref:TPR-like protein n=1 Tax=Ceraceosorus guamensis TaxID=1522189 RepID=A0A316VZ00_9BASI|nr:hypothetical protein IE81DRAFT_289951 [Ceraceosorus guamensis]PWN42672.1 hypothetical protein IE81DRAFT_289951 [Ceraceosorus guamensis]
MPSFGKKSGAGVAAAVGGRRESTYSSGDDAPPVPEVHQEALASNGYTNGAASPPRSPVTTSPAPPKSGRRTTWNKSAPKSFAEAAPALDAQATSRIDSILSHKPSGGDLHKKDTSDGSQQQGYLSSAVGAATGAAVGAGAAVAAGATAVASKVLGTENGTPESKQKQQANGYDDSDDESDEFHDAELADIEEHEEEEDHHTRKQSHRQGMHRGLSEAALGGASAASSTYGGPRSGSPETTTASLAPSSLRGTSGAKRRSGSVPVGGDETSTPADVKAKKETPLYVREKAARVQRLTFDDVALEEDEMEDDIKVARHALNLFLNSRMIEAEEIMKKHSDRKLYYALGDALIAVIKGIMTFEPEDLGKAISYCKDTLVIANMLRKPSSTVANFGRFVRGTGQSASTMAGMSKVQRHAELVYAESLLLKAVMGILYSGDFFAFVSEALNLRNAYGIYRSLSKYVEWADDKASGSRDKSVDEDFRSGVYLGNGLISMILGLLPGKVLKIMEVFGYTGDTQWALKTLSRAGGWSQDKRKTEPAMRIEDEGLRRQVCDMGILLYHLVISTFIPVNGTDIDFADKVLHYNLDRYPQGVFFLYFSGRLYSTQSLAERAVVQFGAARDVQKEYVQLQHICYWDMSLCHMSLAQWEKAYDCFTVLLKESNWSKAVYNYGRAVNLLQCGKDDKAAAALFRTVPDAMQRIAGKSIPMEKYCARKAKKFIKQKRLLLPAVEFSYIYHCLTNAPRYALFDEQLIEISDALADLRDVEDPSQYHSGADEYWDDFCLAHFLRGVVLRYIAYPEKHARVDPAESPIPIAEADKQCEISLRKVIDEGHKISLDHYLVYFAHYELGRLHACRGQVDQARDQFNLIMNGKNLEDKGRKGKYSMQNMCVLRSNGALQTLG